MNRKTITIIGAVLILGVLGAGVFTAVRLLTESSENGVAGTTGQVNEAVMIGPDGASAPLRTDTVPAPELPPEAETAVGIVNGMQDNSIMIGTGNLQMSFSIESDGVTGEEKAVLVPQTDGPEVEVVVDPDTIVYEDITDDTQKNTADDGTVTVKQAVRRVDATDKIEEKMLLKVWGRQRGDRIIADVIVYKALSLR